MTENIINRKKINVRELMGSKSLFFTSFLLLMLLITFQSTGAAPGNVNGEGAVGTIGKWVPSVATSGVICTAPVITSSPVDGQCGSSLNSCTQGTFADATDTSTESRWECQGQNGGSTAQCSLPVTSEPINGQCGSSVNSCTQGTFADVTDTSTESRWECQGQNGGSTAQCSLPITGSFELEAAGPLEVDFSLFISESTATTITILVSPVGIFTEPVTLSVIAVRDVNGNIVSIPGFTPMFEPNPVPLPQFTSGSEFTVSVSSLAADPDVDQMFTMTVQGRNPNGTIVDTVDVGLTLFASNPGFEEQ